MADAKETSHGVLRGNPHRPGCPRYSGMGECDCFNDSPTSQPLTEVRPNVYTTDSGPGVVDIRARLREALERKVMQPESQNLSRQQTSERFSNGSRFYNIGAGPARSPHDFARVYGSGGIYEKRIKRNRMGD